MYKRSDLAEDIISKKLSDIGLYPKINRKKKNGKNIPQTIKFKGKTYLLPDILVYNGDDEIAVVLRIEVKSFFRFIKSKSPNPKENLIPIKTRQLNSYYRLQEKEGVPLRFVVVIGDVYSDGKELDFYNISMNKLTSIPNYRHNYDGEKGYWFDISYFNSGVY